MLPDRVSNPGPLTYESGALPIALRGPALIKDKSNCSDTMNMFGNNFNLKSHITNRQVYSKENYIYVLC